ncbi:MAG: ABC transporter permease [Candidatus Eisenbacteria bacterium]|nr:ABC transporter permease [Candidatus Eisenbacteria bacterium]
MKFSKIELNLRAAVGRAYVRVVAANREPSWIITETVLPLLSIFAFVYIYRAMKAPEEFVGFVVLGGAMTAYWMNVLWSMASQFYWERETGLLQLYLVAPCSRMAILLGMAVGAIIMTTTRAASAIILGSLIFKVHYQITSIPLLIVIFFLTMLSLYGLGMMLSSLFLFFGREAWHTVNLLQEPVYLVSGFYFPVRALGFWFALAGSIIPLTLGLDGMRQLLFGPEKARGFLDVRLEALILLVLGVIFLIGAQKSLSFMERKGKEEGRLTLRWQ